MRASWAIVVLLALAACANRETLADQECETSTDQLTYATFGESFFAQHCQSCHASNASDRHGAPGEFTFDDPAQIRAHADRIFARAAYDNTSMPPAGGDVSAGERQLLGMWLACGAP